ncbi:unnamed protein product [Ectocarpus sp. 12 AP-2014]
MYFVKIPHLPPALRDEFYFYREKDQPSLSSSTVLTSKLALARAFQLYYPFTRKLHFFFTPWGFEVKTSASGTTSATSGLRGYHYTTGATGCAGKYRRNDLQRIQRKASVVARRKKVRQTFHEV